MKHREQKGIALLMAMILLIMIGGYVFYRMANNIPNQSHQNENTLLRLNEAKEALIAYAATDPNRPGRLICPDLVGGGDTDWSLSRIYCDKFTGWLPGKTLRLANYADETGLNFRYHLSPLFGGNPPTEINSETETILRLNVIDPSPSNEIVALIIATRGDVDPRNADGDNYFYSGNSNSPLDNDLIVTITRSELMAATESRIANELRLCLEKHPVDSKNIEKTYPWPAPLANDIYKGASGSLFGMVPETQPGNPDEALQQTISQLDTSKISLDLALTAGDLTAQRSAILETQEIAAYARAQFDRLFIVASALKKAADEAAEDEFCNTQSPKPNFKSLNLLFQSGTSDGTTFTNSVSGFSEITQKTLPTFAPLLDALINSGLDLFTTELKAQNNRLLLRRNAVAVTIIDTPLNALLTQINSIRNGLLDYSLTTNFALNASLASAISAVAIAHTDTLAATKALGDIDKLNLAVTSTDLLIEANNTLLTTAQANGFTPGLIERAGEIIITANRLADRSIQLSANIEEIERTSLIFLTENSRALTASIQPSKDLLDLYENALRLLDISLDTLRNPSTNRSNITPVLINASKSMYLLANAIHPAPAREALIAFKSNLLDSINTPPATLNAATILANQIKGILYWAKVASDQANDIARLSRKSVCAKGDSTGSAYTAARKLLDSIDGESGSIAAIDKPNIDTMSKVTTTAALLDVLLNKTKTLEQNLEAPYASAAIPTRWYGNGCTLLKPPTADLTWWVKDKWGKYFFYQISERIRNDANTGRLKVNGKGEYRVVVVSAGAPLAGQVRSVRETKSFLEGNNPHSSRNGLAQSPIIDFYDVARSHIFNDRVAYICAAPGSASKC